MPLIKKGFFRVLLHNVNKIVTLNFLLQKRGDLKVSMSDTSDLDRQIEQLKRCEIIQEAEVKALCAKAREILVEESNVQRVDSPVTVIFLTTLRYMKTSFIHLA